MNYYICRQCESKTDKPCKLAVDHSPNLPTACPFSTTTEPVYSDWVEIDSNGTEVETLQEAKNETGSDT